MAMHKFRRRIKKAVPRAKHVYNVPEAGIGVRDEISRRAFFPSKYHSQRRSLTRSLVSGARSDVTRMYVDLSSTTRISMDTIINFKYFLHDFFLQKNEIFIDKVYVL